MENKLFSVSITEFTGKKHNKPVRRWLGVVMAENKDAAGARIINKKYNGMLPEHFYCSVYEEPDGIVRIS